MERLRRGLCLIIVVELSILLWPTPFLAANPFVPPENIQLFYQLVSPDSSEIAIEYKMHMNTGDKKIALLNSTFVSEGDTFEGMKVVSVNSERVVLLSPSGEKRVVVIDATQSKLQKLREMMNEGKQ